MVFKHRLYEYLKLAEACAASFIGGKQLTIEQTEAQDAWRALKDGQSSSRIISSLTLRQAMAIFDELFFHGSLQGVTLVVKRKPIYDGAEQLCGITTYIDRDSWIPMAQILIHPKHAFEYSKHKGDNLFLSACACLLHEMCHAFLDMYGCNDCKPSEWRNGCSKNADSTCNRTHTDNVGQRGHGRAWHTLAKAIEDSATDLLGTTMRLYNFEDVVSEINGTDAKSKAIANRWIPSDCDINKFFSKDEARVVRSAITAVRRRNEVKSKSKQNKTHKARKSSSSVDHIVSGRVVKTRGR
jgi:hypothetical protein